MSVCLHVCVCARQINQDISVFSFSSFASKCRIIKYSCLFFSSQYILGLCRLEMTMVSLENDESMVDVVEVMSISVIDV